MGMPNPSLNLLMIRILKISESGLPTGRQVRLPLWSPFCHHEIGDASILSIFCLTSVYDIDIFISIYS